MSKLGLLSRPSIAKFALFFLITGYILSGETPNHRFIHLVLSSAARAAMGPLLDLGVAVNINGSSEPALLGKAFTDLFKEHQHPSSVGPTGAVMPQYAAKIIGTMSKKVFLG